MGAKKDSRDWHVLKGLSDLLGDFGPAIEPPRSTRERSQAESVIDKFGGARQLKEALELAGYPINIVTIYRWTYPRDQKGCGGFIPVAAWPAILDAARFSGVLLTADQFDPRRAAIVQNLATPRYIWAMKKKGAKK